MQLILNALGLILGFIGTILVFRYGLPAIEVLNSGAYVETEVTAEMRQYSTRSRWGLGMIAVGFLSQLIALFVKTGT